MTPPKAVRHLTPEQLSERWDIPVGTLKRWRRERKGPRFLRIGRHPVYPLTYVEAYEKTCLVDTIAV